MTTFCSLLFNLAFYFICIVLKEPHNAVTTPGRSNRLFFKHDIYHNYSFFYILILFSLKEVVVQKTCFSVKKNMFFLVIIFLDIKNYQIIKNYKLISL